MLDDIRNLSTEPEISINGHDLTHAQAMMIRVLLLTLVADLERAMSKPQATDHRNQTQTYQGLAVSILRLMRDA
jgi:hypothetical protein